MNKTLTTIGKILDCNPHGVVIFDELREQAIQLALNLGAEKKEAGLNELYRLWEPEGFGATPPAKSVGEEPDICAALKLQLSESPAQMPESGRPCGPFDVRCPMG